MQSFTNKFWGRLTEEKITYSPDAPASLRNQWKFLQDGARAHTAKKSITLIHELIGNRLHKHPAKSPDLNIIENVVVLSRFKSKGGSNYLNCVS